MSGSSYRLETPRARPPPPPLRFQNSPISSTVLGADSNAQTLLYDLPAASSPPLSSSYKRDRLVSPSSPTSRSGRAPGSGRPTPPLPATRNRSVTPVGVTPSEFEEFEELCRAWYYNQDDNAGRLMTQTLAHLPPSQRAPFSRLQASIRSAYHANVNARRTAEFQAHLAATQPGGSLMPHSRSNPRRSAARKERLERFERFVRSWCTLGMPGTKPFFEALWAIMRLQVVPESFGGAGGFRIQWELDDAVFKEAAGKDFMLEAIDVLKGALAFEETGSSWRQSSNNAEELYFSTQSQTISSTKPKSIASTTTPAVPKRARAPSDPFLDTPPASHSVTSAPSQSPGNTTALLSSNSQDPPVEEPTSPFSSTPPDGHRLFVQAYTLYDSDEEHLRVWTAPDLPNPEYVALLKVFPSFISRRAMPRFPVSSKSSRHRDVEEGDEEGREGTRIRIETGSIWISSVARTSGWEDGWWARFMLWLRRLLC